MTSIVRRQLLAAAAAGIVASVGLVFASPGAGIIARIDAGDRGLDVFLAIMGLVVFVVGGTMAVKATAAAARAALEARSGSARSAPLATVLSILGYVILGLAALGVVGVRLEGLLLGGALTGVIVGIAAQQTLGNIFAGIVLIAVRPFVVGETVRLRGASLGGEYEGVVGDIGLFYVEMMTKEGLVALPNAGVLSAAVGPGARTVTQTPPKRRSRRA
jgi:small-conductance mechanosensitive channel